MNEFYFNTKLDQTLLLGRTAKNIPELLEGVKEVPEASIYYHTHKFLHQHHFLSPEPPNDFSYWITEVLNDAQLGEIISSVDIIQFQSLEDLRSRFVEILSEQPLQERRTQLAPQGEEFHFMCSRTFVLRTPHVAHNLEEFTEVLKRVSVNSLYYHIFDAKLRLEKGENDFSRWFRDMGKPELAERVARLDPYTYTLEGLRSRIIRLVEQYGKN
jgi:hypothetical protein